MVIMKHWKRRHGQTVQHTTAGGVATTVLAATLEVHIYVLDNMDVLCMYMYIHKYTSTLYNAYTDMCIYMYTYVCTYRSSLSLS